MFFKGVESQEALVAKFGIAPSAMRAQQFFGASALLPGERVEYINTFKKEKGKWKLLLIVSETGSELGAGATPPKSLGEGRS